MRRFSDSQFGDTYSDMMPPPYDQPQHPPAEQQDAASIDNNHKLLHFSPPVYHFTLLDYTLRPTSLSINAQLHGMFFLAESPWTASPTTDMPPPNSELTCYRRNLFQITGSVTLPSGLRYIMTDNGRIPVMRYALTVSATESVEGNPVKIISVPWKTPAANAATGQPEDKTEKEPPSIPLEIQPGQEMDSDYATFPIAWKRLQFRIATANNGRRKELQQHFIIRLKVIAELSTGPFVPICEALSGPVIVRGRSPRNFQSRKDLPLSGSAVASRKHAQAASNRGATQDSAKSQQAAGSKRSKSPQEPTPAPLSLHFDSDSKTPQQDAPQQQQQQRTPPSTVQEWPGVTATASAPFPTYTSASITGVIPAYTQSGSELSGPPGKRRRTTNNTHTTNDNHNHTINPVGTISLSLLDDNPSVTERPSSSSTANANPVTSPRVRLANGHASHHNQQQQQQQQQQRQKPTDGVTEMPRKSPTSPPSTQQPRSIGPYNNMSLLAQFSHQLSPQMVPPQYMNANETADALYEYFPLGLDEWQEPIDGVYRPHVVHHTNMPDDPKALAARNRSKRYFAGEAS
jgi:hypothetical protein